MCSDIAISVKNLTKTYRVFGHPGDRIKQAFSFGKVRFHREFTALQDVSFDIKKGETVGIIGRNGSGKSTLLQLICGILKPTHGSVQIAGRISALLELGAGFNPEFTGRENVYFQGAVMGFSESEMARRFDAIAAMADIGDFIDQPVRIYSSGMFVRLAFAVAISVDPDILVIDEALAVGDARFQAKCFGRLRDMKDSGTTVLLVTHSTEQILRHCDRVVLLENGSVDGDLGLPRDMVNRYIALTMAAPSTPTHRAVANVQDVEPFCSCPNYNPNESRSGNGKARIYNFRLITPESIEHQLILELDVAFFSEVRYPLYGLFIRTADGVTLFATNSEAENAKGRQQIRQKEGDCVTVHFELFPNLCAGDYFFSIAVSDISYGDKEVLDRRHDAIHWSPTFPISLEGMVNMRPTVYTTPLVIGGST